VKVKSARPRTRATRFCDNPSRHHSSRRATPTIIDRLQSAGFGNTKMRLRRSAEIGKPSTSVGTKVPGEPTSPSPWRSFDVSTEIERADRRSRRWHPHHGPRYTDVDGTANKIDGCSHPVREHHEPWRDPLSSAGTIDAGHIVPATSHEDQLQVRCQGERASETGGPPGLDVLTTTSHPRSSTTQPAMP